MVAIRRLDGDLDPTACEEKAADSVGVGRESGPGGKGCQPRRFQIPRGSYVVVE